MWLAPGSYQAKERIDLCMVISTTVRIRNCSEFRIAHDLWVNTDSNVFLKVLRDLAYICVCVKSRCAWGYTCQKLTLDIFLNYFASFFSWNNIHWEFHTCIPCILVECILHSFHYPQHPHLHPSSQLFSSCLPFFIPTKSKFCCTECEGLPTRAWSTCQGLYT